MKENEGGAKEERKQEGRRIVPGLSKYGSINPFQQKLKRSCRQDIPRKLVYSSPKAKRTTAVTGKLALEIGF